MIIPSRFQPELPLEHFIVSEKPNAEAVPLDVLFVGGGPAGLSGAIELARLIKKDKEGGGNLGTVEIGVLEKAAGLGEHCLSGAVVNPRAFRELFPDLKDKDFPFRGAVSGDQVFLLTEGGKCRIPTPPTMHNSGNFVASICEIVQWLGKKAEESGVQILAGFPAASLLVEDKKVLGVRTVPAGLNRQGQPGQGYMPPTDVTAKVTVLTEGTRGSLTQAFLQWQHLKSPNPQIFALGVKELWKTKKVPQSVIHTLGWPLPRDAFGGSFLYPMGPDMVSFGLVVGLDYHQHSLDVHSLLQKLKKHPLFQEYLEGGELLEWGAKTIPEGGFYALPERLNGEGILLAGDTVGMVNVPALKGIHYAMQSGIFAARTIFQALKAGDFSAKKLSVYDDLVRSSYIYKDLRRTRNMRLAFKSGFYSGGIKSALMTVTGGTFPGGRISSGSDAEEPREVTAPAAKGEKELGKVEGVFLAGNKTRDDIPSHLIVGKNIPPDVAEFYSHVCPAGVYERQGDKLVVNAPNCIDCKATDVLGPRWTPREGGSGPSYKRM